MILNNAPAHEAIVSNVAEIGEFRIRNSAKAFSILSSGLYANKVRAIIRELSCNAVDSHAAAGKKDTPFDVHLPNSLEPHFSIRDYGTGLTHEQVTQIYTTYFESTKTGSNEFIGALGLGSKSPFSYTDNFTVTAICGGKKGVYSAFINANGVPSIALMMTEESDEPAGVEVKFSVNDRCDFDKFRQEARQVYTHFALRPVVSGYADFKFTDVEYETRDIIPGVHGVLGGRTSVAVMGNIAYPIDVPQSERSQNNDIYTLLNCGLEMHFGIGELDFQASREGLSYIPETIAAIKAKLEAVNQQLAVHIALEADKIDNLWDRAVFLYTKREHTLWANAVKKYATDTKLVTYMTDKGNYDRLAKFTFKVDDLVTDYNIQLRVLTRARHAKTVSNVKPNSEYSDQKLPNGHYDTWTVWGVAVDSTSHFIINDIKTGAGERARYHYRETECKVYQRTIYVIEPVDRSKPMKTTEFFAAIYEPPMDRRMQASALLSKERAQGNGKNVTILSLEKRGGNRGYRSDDEMVWRDAGKADTFDSKTTFYYVPLSGFQMLSAKGYSTGKELYEDVQGLSGLFSGTIYGVRKGDIEDIKKRANWKNFEEHIEKTLNGQNNDKLLMSLVKSGLAGSDIFNFPNNNIVPMIDANSPYTVFINVFKGVDKFKGSQYNVDRLFRKFAPNANLSPATLIEKYQAQLTAVTSRYPLLTKLNTYRVEAGDIAEYVNLIDAKKGI